MEVARIVNTKLETNNIVLDGNVLPNFLISQGWKRVNRTTVTLDQYETKITEFTENEDTIEIREVKSDILFEEAKQQKNEELSQAFREDIIWTEEEKEFYEKYKSLNPEDTSYDSWYQRVLAYWNEAYTEKSANNESLESASTVSDLRAIQYSPTHTESFDILKTPIQEQNAG